MITQSRYTAFTERRGRRLKALLFMRFAEISRWSLGVEFCVGIHGQDRYIFNECPSFGGNQGGNADIFVPVLRQKALKQGLFVL